MTPKVKICCMANAAEVAMAAGAGAHMVGLVGPMPSGPGVLSLPACHAIAKACPPQVTPVLLTSSETAPDIARDVKAAGVGTVQVLRPVGAAVHRSLDRLLPGVQRWQAIHVEGPDALDQIPIYAPHIDAFLLDSGRLARDELGGTGRTHNWSISRAFVQAAPVPVFLAGGLTSANAAQAMEEVRPYGLDICSGLRTDDALDPAKLAAFMAAIGIGMGADIGQGGP